MSEHFLSAVRVEKDSAPGVDLFLGVRYGSSGVVYAYLDQGDRVRVVATENKNFKPLTQWSGVLLK